MKTNLPFRFLMALALAGTVTGCGEAFLAANSPAVEGRDNTGASVMYVDEALISNCALETPSAFFSTDGTTLSTAAREHLGEVAACLTTGTLAGHGVAVHGYADPRGSEGYNARLAFDRAEAVASALRAQGLPANRVKVYSHGEMEARGEGPHGYVFDRRVQLKLIERSDLSSL